MYFATNISLLIYECSKHDGRRNISLFSVTSINLSEMKEDLIYLR